MPIEFTEDEKKKLDAYLKEVGFENANPTEFLKQLREEAKTNRERADASEKTLKSVNDQLKVLLDEKTKRDEADRKKTEEEAADKKRAEEEKMTLDQRIAELRKEMDEKVGGMTKAHEAELKALEKKLGERDAAVAKRDQISLRSAVRSAAERRGIIDPDLADYFDLKDIKIVDGEPDTKAIDALIETHAKEKPVLYKDEATRRREDAFRTTPLASSARPTPEDKTPQGGKDWSKMSDADFAAEEAKIGLTRV